MKVPRFPALILAVAMIAACGDDTPTQTPTAPTTPVVPATPAPAPAPVAPNVTAPTLDTPSDDQQLDTLRPVLRVANATADQAGTRTYDFQIADNSNFTVGADTYLATYRVVVSKDGVPEGSDGKTSWSPDVDLQPTTRLYWRARATQGSTVSNWSPTGRFKTRVMGYVRGNEVFDPLTNGATVGIIVGPVTLIPSRGALINDFGGHVAYRLQPTLTAGELSAIVEVPTETPGDKTKMFGMFDGGDDIVTSDWRTTVEKRADGTIAWRHITGAAEETQIDTVGGERVRVDFGNGGPHFWKITWGGGFNLIIRQGSETGNKIYDFGKGVGGVYNPQPHMVYLGAPSGRSGINSASVPGALYRNVWISDKPRPATLGNALDR